MKYPARTALAVLLLLSLKPVHAQFGAGSGGYSPENLGSISVPTPSAPEALRTGSAAAAPPKDDLKTTVLRNLDEAIRYCDANPENCNGDGNRLRNFAQGIGGGRCNNRGFNCAGEVLKTCTQELESGKVVPMYYMACAAFLGKLGERDCDEGRETCAARLQGSVYFALRAAAGCHESYKNDQENRAAADKLANRFAATINQNVKDVYVQDVPEAPSLKSHLVWKAVDAVKGKVQGKILEFAFERLAWHGAQSVMAAANGPLSVYSNLMFIHSIAASEMNNQVCLKWNHSYNGSYANTSVSLVKMTEMISAP
jgi:hypothetical protein